MSIIYVLIPIAMIFVMIGIGVFFWAVKSEQFDDLERQSMSILFDEDAPKASNQLEPAADTQATASEVDKG
ncbi:cbb3-type cytochrome oxidase assembly protein CcoS [Shewanella sp. AS16]|uniref:cbb3-type cytochrome oxidase assembly protein CcoS n=1 Tax=Shewanella sp. AS16 TaxID=2907625 RepID=UPI001F1AC5E1|nr:cbb3-type cytochrome oxidase assembly protein CcoS [Shewanella sp. AS16]MCE9687362.1 cbb3-type cytochrome oxidase assembly protein CcoS [Shewanella sp. AS16]